MGLYIHIRVSWALISGFLRTVVLCVLVIRLVSFLDFVFGTIGGVGNRIEVCGAVAYKKRDCPLITNYKDIGVLQCRSLRWNLLGGSGRCLGREAIGMIEAGHCYTCMLGKATSERCVYSRRDKFL